MAQSEKKVVEANEFVLKDEQGRVRARIGLSNDNQPAIDLLDEAGQPRLSLELAANQSPYVTLRDEKARMRADLAVNGDQVALTFLSTTEETTVFLFSADDGDAALAITDQTNVIRSVLGVERNGSPIFRLNEGQPDAADEGSESENV